MNVPAEEIISRIRDIMPARAVVNLGEALFLAERQAALLVKLLGIRRVPVDIARICDLPKIEVQTVPRYRIGINRAGQSTHRPGGRWLILINQNEEIGERRVSLAHEFKHVLDHTIRRVAYAHLGFGDPDKHESQIEAICDHFAACLLMPSIIVKRAWFEGIRDIEALAGFFEVPEETVVARLRYLGLSDPTDQPVATYFRSYSHAAPRRQRPAALASAA